MALIGMGKKDRGNRQTRLKRKNITEMAVPFAIPGKRPPRMARLVSKKLKSTLSGNSIFVQTDRQRSNAYAVFL